MLGCLLADYKAVTSQHHLTSTYFHLKSRTKDLRKKNIEEYAGVLIRPHNIVNLTF